VLALIDSRRGMTAAHHMAQPAFIRLDYFEHPSYVPLLRRAYELWHELEQSSDQKLIHINRHRGDRRSGWHADHRRSRIDQTALSRHELLSAEDLMRRYPAFHLPSHYQAVMQPDGGFLAAEPSIHAMLALAK